MSMIDEWIRQVPAEHCDCGQTHRAALPEWLTGRQITARFLDRLSQFDTSHIWLMADPDTYAAAGRHLEQAIRDRHMPISCFIFQGRRPEASEHTVAAARLGVPDDMSLLLAVGSGTINDIAKVIAAETNVPFFVYATAPSMDGYTSATSSLLIDGRKVSLATKAADLVAADTDVLAAAPMEAIQSGVGDVVAKAVSLAEWQMASVITGEHYCPRIAGLVEHALETVLASAPRLLDREPDAVEALFAGLLVSGLAMNLAGHSRPASGMEHYISHLWDMRAAALGTSADTHGRQCGVGTLLALDLIERTCRLQPTAERADAHLDRFVLAAWHDELKTLLGPAALPLIEAETSEQKYDPDKVRNRAGRIICNWPIISGILQSVITRREAIAAALSAVHAPLTVGELTVSEPETEKVLLATRDIRDKYITTRLLFDTGETDSIHAG